MEYVILIYQMLNFKCAAPASTESPKQIRIGERVENKITSVIRHNSHLQHVIYALLELASCLIVIW